MLLPPCIMKTLKNREKFKIFSYDWEVGDGQGGLACCSPWGCKESGMTEQLN